MHLLFVPLTFQSFTALIRRCKPINETEDAKKTATNESVTRILLFVARYSRANQCANQRYPDATNCDNFHFVLRDLHKYYKLYAKSC